jgi:hypothetical protein
VDSFIRSAIALFATLTLGYAAVSDDGRGSRDKLVPEMIRLLESKEDEAVIATSDLPRKQPCVPAEGDRVHEDRTPLVYEITALPC